MIELLDEKDDLDNLSHEQAVIYVKHYSVSDSRAITSIFRMLTEGTWILLPSGEGHIALECKGKDRYRITEEINAS